MRGVSNKNCLLIFSLFQILGLVGGIFLIFIQILKETSVPNIGEPDQTPPFASSDLVLHSQKGRYAYMG